MSYIVFDIGGTNMRVAYSRDGVPFEEPRIVHTPKDFDEGMREFGRLARECAGGAPITHAGGGIASPLSRDRTTILNSPHLPGWSGKPVREAMSHELGVPVFIENDTAIVGLGEAVAGAGKGYPIVAYMTISTGVGGVRIVNEKIDISAVGFEPGHQIIDASGGLHATSVGGNGIDLEGYISGTAISERYGKKPYEITDAPFWDEMARLLAYGINNTIVHWSPDVVVLGGSMMNTIGIPVDRVEAHLRGLLHIFPELPVIAHSSLADIGGLHGGLAFVRQHIAQ
jgi:predicted NBD/HSP70 family sugar kinase